MSQPPVAVTTAGHPRGLYTLFFTEMWERLSFYGMRALLVLFMVDSVQKGGLGLTDGVATAIYGLYTAGVYLSALPGGWVADRLLGARRAVWVGGILITVGHFVLAVPSVEVFFLGLLLLVLGTGLLKPNISTLVGQLYPEGGARRDAGFTIFYMGINLGAMLGPLLCSYLGEEFSWHYGFAAAGIGMALGLVQFGLTQKYLGEIGLPPAAVAGTARRDWGILGVCLAVLATVVVLAMTRVLTIDPLWLAHRTTILISGLAIAYFIWAFFFAGLDAIERQRVGVIAVLFLVSALFWAGYEQAGSSLNLFAERYTQRNIESLNFEIKTGWFQSFSAGAVIVLAPLIAVLWVKLARRGLSPSLPAKFAIALLFLASGFLVMVFASKKALNHGPVWPTWLMTTYILHVLGELCLSPVGLSSVTKLAPRRLVGQMMGVWFLATSLGNLLAGIFAGEVSGENANAMPERYLFVVIIVGGAGVLLLLCARPIRKLMSGVE
jgi:POT family proton-dependent oligopeptide transporter